MTNEEASNILDDFDVNFEGHTAKEVAEAFDVAFRALEQQPCEDAISRQAVEKITWEEPSYTDPLNVLTEIREKVRALPPVAPKEKTGRWIYKQGIFGALYCSKCDFELKTNYAKYCPNCGCQMRGDNNGNE